MKIRKLLPTLIMQFSSASYAAEPLFYVVKYGDTLSTIAQKKIGVPIFRKGDGSLFKLLKLNPNVRDADLIFPGQALVIRSSEVQSLAVKKIKSVEKVQTEMNLQKPASSISAVEKPAPSETAKFCEMPSGKTNARRERHDRNLGLKLVLKWREVFGELGRDNFLLLEWQRMGDISRLRDSQRRDHNANQYSKLPIVRRRYRNSSD